MTTLAQHANVMDTAVALLKRKGYQIWRNDEEELYYAERDGWDFAGEDPIALLGLITIFEAAQPAIFREYWWRDEGATGAERRLPTRPEHDYTPVYMRVQRPPRE